MIAPADFNTHFYCDGADWPQTPQQQEAERAFLGNLSHDALIPAPDNHQDGANPVCVPSVFLRNKPRIIASVNEKHPV